jgi:HK97 family phage major capsid protein
VKGQVQFYVRKRVGGAVRDSNAIKVLRVSTN